MTPGLDFDANRCECASDTGDAPVIGPFFKRLTDWQCTSLIVLRNKLSRAKNEQHCSTFMLVLLKKPKESRKLGLTASTLEKRQCVLESSACETLRRSHAICSISCPVKFSMNRKMAAAFGHMENHKWH